MLFVAKELKESLVVDLLECEERHFVYFLRDNILEELDMIWKRVTLAISWGSMWLVACLTGHKSTMSSSWQSLASLLRTGSRAGSFWSVR